MSELKEFEEEYLSQFPDVTISQVDCSPFGTRIEYYSHEERAVVKTKFIKKEDSPSWKEWKEICYQRFLEKRKGI